MSYNIDDVVVLDLETTGFGGTSEVLEVALIDGLGNPLLHEFCGTETNSEWPHAQAIHGISPEDVRGKPTFKSILPKLISLCKDKSVIIYNKKFDLSYCEGLDDSAKSIYCCMIRFSDHYGGAKGSRWVKLEKAAAITGFDWGEHKAHCALSDTLATLHVWRYLDGKGVSHA